MSFLATLLRRKRDIGGLAPAGAGSLLFFHVRATPCRRLTSTGLIGSSRLCSSAEVRMPAGMVLRHSPREQRQRTASARLAPARGDGNEDQRLVSITFCTRSYAQPATVAANDRRSRCARRTHDH